MIGKSNFGHERVCFVEVEHLKKSRDIKWLKKMSKIIRVDILEMIGVGKKGHLGGSMSSADLVDLIENEKLSIDDSLFISFILDSLFDSFFHSKGMSTCWSLSMSNFLIA